MHSSNLEVTDTNLSMYIKDMDAILDDPMRLRYELYAKEARTKLQKLLENDIYISTTDEISLIREAQRSLERNNNIQADSLHDIVQSLDQMKEENQDRFEGIDKAYDSLRKAIDDINNKSIDQQKLASDMHQVKNDLESLKEEAKFDRKRIVIVENSLKEIDSLLKEMTCVACSSNDKDESACWYTLWYIWFVLGLFIVVIGVLVVLYIKHRTKERNREARRRRRSTRTYPIHIVPTRPPAYAEPSHKPPSYDEATSQQRDSINSLQVPGIIPYYTDDYGYQPPPTSLRMVSALDYTVQPLPPPYDPSTPRQYLPN